MDQAKAEPNMECEPTCWLPKDRDSHLYTEHGLGRFLSFEDQRAGVRVEDRYTPIPLQDLANSASTALEAARAKVRIEASAKKLKKDKKAKKEKEKEREKEKGEGEGEGEGGDRRCGEFAEGQGAAPQGVPANTNANTSQLPPYVVLILAARTPVISPQPTRIRKSNRHPAVQGYGRSNAQATPPLTPTLGHHLGPGTQYTDDMAALDHFGAGPP
ncbi:hypothetical protein B0T14DRAFT_559243 [Immersiella caudata]|uniref:Uncharacterized protein n=1 Tax=Immersiella caudata TaxID=314043 RepID=A0AA39XD18_9PEZI|nr:hypothetical protein B0T14DRAFT_559243 [Immersiella caudata]